MAIKVAQPFKRTTSAPIDDTIVLTKAEMLTVEENEMPNVYFAMCKDDGKLYVYNSENTSDPETGKYRVYENGDGTKVRELTQAEYDALSDTEKNNGTIYFITDGHGGGSSPISATLGRWEKITEIQGSEIPTTYTIDFSKYNAITITSIAWWGEVNECFITVEDFTIGKKITTSYYDLNPDENRTVMIERTGENTISIDNANGMGICIYGYKETSLTDSDAKKLAKKVVEELDPVLEDKVTGYDHKSSYTVVFDDDTMPKPTKADTLIDLHLYTGDYDNNQEVSANNVVKLVNNETVVMQVWIPGGQGEATLTLTPTSDNTMRYKIELPSSVTDFWKIVTTFSRLERIGYSLMPDRVRTKLEMIAGRNTSLNKTIPSVISDDPPVEVQLELLNAPHDKFNAFGVCSLICKDANNKTVPVVVTSVRMQGGINLRALVGLKCLGSTDKTIVSVTGTLFGRLEYIWD